MSSKCEVCNFVQKHTDMGIKLRATSYVLLNCGELGINNFIINHCQ